MVYGVVGRSRAGQGGLAFGSAMAASRDCQSGKMMYAVMVRRCSKKRYLAPQAATAVRHARTHRLAAVWKAKGPSRDWGQAAMAISVTGSTSALNSWPKLEPSLPWHNGPGAGDRCRGGTIASAALWSCGG